MSYHLRGPPRDDVILPTSGLHTNYFRRHSGAQVLLLGDSMIKHLNPRQLQNGINRKIIVKTFPGAGIDDIWFTTLDLHC